MEEEDEELVHLNTGLYSHLLQAGYNDIEIITPIKHPSKYSGTQNQAKTVVNDANYNFFAKSFGNCRVQINQILKSTLIFEDDLVVIQNCLSEEPDDCKLRFSLTKEICKILGVNFACITALVINNYQFKKLPLHITVPLSTLPIAIYTVRRLYFNYRGAYYRKCVSSLLSCLKRFSVLLHKSAQYVQECELIACENPAIKKKMQAISKLIETRLSDEKSVKWHMMFDLRTVILNSATVIASVFRTAVLTLLKEFPLTQNVDDIDYYLSHLQPHEMDIRQYEPHEISTQILQKFKCLYLLLQSEFLKRICLSFDISLWIGDPYKPMSTLFDIVRYVTNVCQREYNPLNERFNYYYYQFERKSNNSNNNNNNNNGKIQTIANNKLDTKLKEIYFKTKTVADNLRFTAVETRIFEQFIESKIDIDADVLLSDETIENRLIEISRLCARSKTSLDDLISTVTKARLSNKREEETPTINKPSESIDIDKDKSIKNIDNALERTIINRDEIYIAISSSDNDDRLYDDYCENDRDGRSSREINYSKNLMDELKIVLKRKQIEWKRREKLALRRTDAKYDDVISSSESDDSTDETNNSSKDVTSTEDFSKNIQNSNNYSYDEKQTNGTSFAKQIADLSSKWALTEICYNTDGEDDSEN